MKKQTKLKKTRKVFFLREELEKAGISIGVKAIFRNLLIVSILIAILATIWVVYLNSIHPFERQVSYYIAFILVICFPLILIIVWFFFYYVILDLKKFKRKTELEDVLPDFLQLVSANIRAGMTIDKAMWYAIRPRFGVLAQEIETVAKESMAGKSLTDALIEVTKKFDSVILKRSISLINEGITSGGEIGSLLNGLAINIQEIKIRRKEMAANITTYMIFIAFAAILAAPILFALCTQLLHVINAIAEKVNIPEAGTALGISFSFSKSAVSENDFRIFAVVYLTISSFFSSLIIASIRKGSIKGGFKYIIIFIVLTLSLYFLLWWILGRFFENFFTF